jgi:tetratricopeptide (TPR) repeat protein
MSRAPRPASHAPPSAFRFLLGLLLFTGLATAAELPEVSQLYLTGQYERVIQEARRAVKADPAEEEWQLLLAQALFETGQYREARSAIESATGRISNSLRLRLLAREIVRLNGDPRRAQTLLDEMDRLGYRSWAYKSPADRVALGRTALLAGADPKKVLDQFFDPVRKEAPDFRDVHLASAELAMGKSDYAIAGRILTAAVKKLPVDPDIQFGLARAFAPSDAEVMAKALEVTLTINPRHVGAHLLRAEHYLDAERFPEAATAIAEALKTNPNRPEAHALAAVLAELEGDAGRFTRERDAALKPWAKNPDVEYLIGKKLSHKYRFAEGAAHQRRALEFDPLYLPAKLQLAQDLLRLGQEEEGWKLAGEVQQADPYDIVAYNLVTLQEKTSHFQVLQNERFIIRMDPAEAGIYGDEALALLDRAYAHLCTKYGLTPKQRTTVEIFPDQKDFAIRTFGLPGADGYLGVCFGPVITANSPAARPGSFNNWQAVLWHEFAHVVTLGLTRNRMPRWLSEGISVYEERQARGNWGEQMKPRYRALILGEDFTPLSKLSSAFLRPKSPVHLQFAYYESSLAVDYLIERYGLPALKAVFADLAAGQSLNTALAKHCAPLAQLDDEFAQRARALAESVAPKLDWAQPGKPDLASAAARAKWLAEHPESYTALMEQAARSIKQRDWAAAKAPLLKLIELYPEQHESDNAYVLLAKVHRELGETDEERARLERIVQLSSDAAPAHERIIELATERKDWPTVIASAEALAAINPLLPTMHRARADAAAALQRPQEAIDAYETLLKLDDTAPPQTRYRLALQYRAAGQAQQAKQRLLESLEDAPRNREALKMLLELNAAPK